MSAKKQSDDDNRFFDMDGSRKNTKSSYTDQDHEENRIVLARNKIENHRIISDLLK